MYLPKIKTNLLKTQCVPLDSDLWRIDQADAFWRERRVLLAGAFNDYVREMLPQRRL